ncbi:MAG: 2-phosphosulfolactate phosphatase [Candidatus Rokuibacteriota bacterium]
MRVDVAPTPDAVAPATLPGAVVLVVDVLRASTSIITALANGCAAVVPVAEPEEARRRAAAIPGALVAGERRGEPLDGFDLGNSPLEFAPERVAGRTIVMTTSNGTRALCAVRGAADVGIGALVNLEAAAAWAAGRGRDVLVVCAGERGVRSLEDWVCAGLLAERIALRTGAVLADGAAAASAAGRAYAGDVSRLARDSRWARHLTASGRGRDVAACLALDTTTLVPLYRANVDKVLSGHP